MRKAILALAAVAAMAVGNPLAESVAAQTAGAADLTPDERGAYVTLAGAFYLHESRAAEIALERSRSEQVRAFAQAAAAEYEERVRNLMEAARAAGIEDLPPAMMPMHWNMLRELEDSSRSRAVGGPTGSATGAPLHRQRG